MRKRFHLHKEQGPFCLFTNITSKFFFVASINIMLTPVLPSVHTNGVRIGKIQKTIMSSRRSNMTDTICSRKEY